MELKITIEDGKVTGVVLPAPDMPADDFRIIDDWKKLNIG
jgi:hypothetical protein